MKLLPAEIIDSEPGEVGRKMAYLADDLMLPRHQWLATRHSRQKPLELSPEDIRNMGVRRVRLRGDMKRPTRTGDRIARPIYVWPVATRHEMHAHVEELYRYRDSVISGWMGPRTLAFGASRLPGRIEGLICATRQTEVLSWNEHPQGTYRFCVASVFVIPVARKKLVAAAMTACIIEQIYRDLQYLNENRNTDILLGRAVEGEVAAPEGMRLFNELAREMGRFVGFNLLPVEEDYA